MIPKILDWITASYQLFAVVIPELLHGPARESICWKRYRSHRQFVIFFFARRFRSVIWNRVDENTTQRL